MKGIAKITTLTSALALLAGFAGVWPGFSAGTEPEGRPQVFTIDTAVDCRTAVGGFNRGDIFILNGKLFPAGTLPAGIASNDPTQPVNGVAPIGDWLVRGHHTTPLSPALAPFYNSAPGDFGTGYFILDKGQTALIAETYAFLAGQAPSQAFTSVTGGIGRFRGAAGDSRGGPIGTNATGCPNFRTTFHLVPGSVRGN